MGTKEEVSRIKKGLDTAIVEESESQIRDYLSALEKVSMTMEILKALKIGVTVNNVRKMASASDDIKKIAGNLANNWKEITSSARSNQPRAAKKAMDYSKENIETAPVIDAQRFQQNDRKGGGGAKIYSELSPPPTRNSHGEFCFVDHPEFRPNMSPKEVLQAGSFGGTYFRPIHSGVTGKDYGDEVWKELPEDWLKGLNVKQQVSSAAYRNSINTYKVKCGGDLNMWESSGWINGIDPYGWFQWYCRFFQGRRSSDDARQIARGNQCMGPKGRWRSNLCGKIISSANSSTRTLQTETDNKDISPVIRQVLQHWGYRVTLKDVTEYKKRKRL
eukprot:GSChrysophyteH1.ASY1.ANO1.1767.1 assembled CDS